MIHLDTSFLIRALIQGTTQDRALRRWIAADETLVMSAIAWTEFQCGPLHPAELATAAALIDHHRDFTREDAESAARLFNDSGRRRGSLVDCMIAAAALADDAPVATANRADFERLQSFGVAIAV